MSAHIFSQVAF